MATAELNWATKEEEDITRRNGDYTSVITDCHLDVNPFPRD